MKRLIAPFLILSIGLCCFSYVRAQNYTLAAEAREIERHPRDLYEIRDHSGLAGLRYIDKVVIEDLTQDALDIGITEESLRIVVELRLRAAGWRITGVQSTPPPEFVYVTLNLGGIEKISGEKTREYCGNISLKVIQPVLLERMHGGKSVRFLGTSWQRSAIMFRTSPDSMAKNARDMLGIFCDELLNDWYKVNPQ